MQAYGKVRNPIVVIILMIVTLGIYSLVWTYKIHEENKVHGGVGPGGVLPLVMVFIPVIGWIYWLIRYFQLPAEIGQMQAATGNPSPMSGLVGLWVVLGWLLFGLGPLIWLFMIQSGMNQVWMARGAPA